MVTSNAFTEPHLEAARSVLEGQIGGQGRGWKIVRVDREVLAGVSWLSRRDPTLSQVSAGVSMESVYCPTQRFGA